MPHTGHLLNYALPKPTKYGKNQQDRFQTPLQAAGPQAFSVDVTVAISAERDQIFVCIITQSSPRAEVVHLKSIGTAAILASPAITLQHFGAEFVIRIWV
jgi:hypothetical protein